MKKIPIKFRGRMWNGQVVSGSYYFENFSDVGAVHAIINEHGEEFIIDPDSVAQLVGYDVDGKEVYEGDTLTDILGNEYTARIRIELICDDRRSTLRGKVYAGTVDNLKLKEKAA